MEAHIKLKQVKIKEIYDYINQMPKRTSFMLVFDEKGRQSVIDVENQCSPILLVKNYDSIKYLEGEEFDSIYINAEKILELYYNFTEIDFQTKGFYPIWRNSYSDTNISQIKENLGFFEIIIGKDEIARKLIEIVQKDNDILLNSFF